MRILFLYLGAFSGIGGIETFNRAFIKALSDLGSQRSFDYKLISLYDDRSDPRYLNTSGFTGYRGNKIRFAISAIKEGLNSDILFLSHINLAPIAVLIKFLKKKLKLFP